MKHAGALTVKTPEPCLCGDPECGRCFPQYGVYEDEDEAYERQRQWEIDEAILEDKNDGG